MARAAALIGFRPLFGGATAAEAGAGDGGTLGLGGGGAVGVFGNASVGGAVRVGGREAAASVADPSETGSLAATDGAMGGGGVGLVVGGAGNGAVGGRATRGEGGDFVGGGATAGEAGSMAYTVGASLERIVFWPQ